jgi:hypothetical protein
MIMIKSKDKYFAISFIMGTDDTIKSRLDSINALYNVENKKYYLTKIPKIKIKEYESIISEYLKPGFWNEYISDKVVFIFKTLYNEILRYEWNESTEEKILDLCNDYAKFNKTSIKEMLLGEEFYKENSIEY